MIEILKFVFSNFWIFVGTCVLLNLTMSGLAELIRGNSTNRLGKYLKEKKITDHDAIIKLLDKIGAEYIDFENMISLSCADKKTYYMKGVGSAGFTFNKCGELTSMNLEE